MAHPRDLVCDVCWEGLFNTQAYQDLFVAPESGTADKTLPRTVIQTTSSQHVRDHCKFVKVPEGIASYAWRPNPTKSGDTEAEAKQDKTCSWCEYIGSFSCSALDEDGKAPDYEHDLLKVSLTTVRVDCSTPLSGPGDGAKVMMLSLDRCERSSGKSMVGNGSMHHGFTSADDPAAAVVVSRPVKSEVGHAEATEQIKAWIHECEREECGEDGGFYRGAILPTRVIDVGLDPGYSHRPRIVDSRGSRGVYATLSYCWGHYKQQEDSASMERPVPQKTPPNITLRKDNVHELQAGIDVDILPKTIRDAIALTRNMSIPYLWVDALCIFQDDELGKAKEIAQMQNIYSGSAVTLIAASASSADEGFLPQGQDPYLPDMQRASVIVPVRLGVDRFGTMRLVDLNRDVCYDERREPISDRAWTMQEQLLARRKLIFTQHNRTMSWSCPHSPLTRNFGGSMHLPYWPGNFSGKEEDFIRETLNLSVLAPDPTSLSPDDKDDKEKALGCWLRLVSAYSLRSATLQTDKLNALAGIAARCYAPLLGPGYYAGIWEYDILRQLTWETSDFHLSLPYSGVTVARPVLENGYSRAPSWSWASVDGGVVAYDQFPKIRKNDNHLDMDDEKEEWMSEVLTITTAPRFKTENSFGEIEPGSGRITLRTTLKRAWWHSSSHSIFRKSCAPTPSRSPSSSSDEESVAPSSPSGGKRGTDLEDEEKEVERSEMDEDDSTEDVSKEDVSKDVNSSTSEENTGGNGSDVPIFDLIQDRVTGGPRTGYVSPFKRVLRRTGPLPPDSDSEFDSASETEKSPATGDPDHHRRDRDRTWWWLVSASLDEIPGDNRYDFEAEERREYEIEHVDPVVVYMLPLVATAHRLPIGPHRNTVRGLLLVKDKTATGGNHDLTGASEDGKGQQAEQVLFKRIGHFTGCPRSEFDKAGLQDVTII